jgi:serine/threonine-protein kinase
MAQRFDVARLELAGDAVVLAKEIQSRVNGFPAGAYSLSTSGVLAYRTAQSVPLSQLVLLNQTGNQLGTFGEKESYLHVSLAPGGGQAAVTVLDRANRTTDIWICDLARGIRTRLTSIGNVGLPTWSPDSKDILFRANRDGRADLYKKAASSLSGEQLLWKDAVTKHPSNWSSDGRFILYYTGLSTLQTGNDIWALPLFGDRKPFPLVKGAFQEANATLSPDGRWITYTSNESGDLELYVTAFPRARSKLRISPAGTRGRAQWRRDGREIYYRTPANKMMSVSVNPRGASFEIGAEQPLFEMPDTMRGWDVSADGKRFLVNVVLPGSAEEDAITLLLNWPALLEQKKR